MAGEFRGGDPGAIRFHSIHVFQEESGILSVQYIAGTGPKQTSDDDRQIGQVRRQSTESKESIKIRDQR